MNTCTKKVFATKYEAAQRAGEINEEIGYREGRKQFRAYQCKGCSNGRRKKWHLTKMPIQIHNEIVKHRAIEKANHVADTARYWERKLRLA